MLGQSMGAATSALYAATDHGKKNLDYLILDSCFESMEYMAFETMKSMGLDEDSALYSAFSANAYLKVFKGFDIDDTNIVKNSKNIITKTLVIQSKQDNLVTIKIGEEIFSSIKNNEKEYLLLDVQHIEGIINAKDIYQKGILKFIKSNN